MADWSKIAPSIQRDAYSGRVLGSCVDDPMQGTSIRYDVRQSENRRCKNWQSKIPGALFEGVRINNARYKVQAMSFEGRGARCKVLRRVRMQESVCGSGRASRLFATELIVIWRAQGTRPSTYPWPRLRKDMSSQDDCSVIYSYGDTMITWHKQLLLLKILIREWSSRIRILKAALRVSKMVTIVTWTRIPLITASYWALNGFPWCNPQGWQMKFFMLYFVLWYWYRLNRCISS